MGLHVRRLSGSFIEDLGQGKNILGPTYPPCCVACVVSAFRYIVIPGYTAYLPSLACCLLPTLAIEMTAIPGVTNTWIPPTFYRRQSHYACNVPPHALPFLPFPGVKTYQAR